jgi:DNA-binding NtrC family response regulator
MPAPLFEAADRPRAEALCRLTWCNPFLDERPALERASLGDQWQPAPSGVEWVDGVPVPPSNPNVAALLELATRLAGQARDRLARRAPSDRERIAYQELVFFVVFHRFADDFQKLIQQARARGAAALRCAFYERFRAELERWCPPAQPELALPYGTERVLAVFFQVRRAYAHIHECIIGASPASRKLRARVWESVFTRDLERYQRALVERMGDLTTLITGPSGSGKELVARAIGLSRYVPFDGARREFATDYLRGFFPVNLAALSPTLIESELFGHRRGAFTGALADRVGYFEACGPHGAVFLDEIGETEPAIQVKLLRVLQTRAFQRIGETEPRVFAGKVLAATNRDLAVEMRAGRFREDLYFRLCADHVRTPPLREILHDAPAELETLVRYVSAKIAGPGEAAALCDQACAALRRCLPAEYAWPGNFRELEQAVRNVLVHGDYFPETWAAEAPSAPAAASGGSTSAAPATGELSAEAVSAVWMSGQATADEWLRGYVRRVHRLAGSYEEAARRLGLDRRTVKKYLRGGPEG